MRIVVIGAGGIFASRIARELASNPGMDLVLAGRRKKPLEALRNEVGQGATVALLDVTASDFPASLAALQPGLVIHAAGPFQHEHNYVVARACIDCGSHYVDLADARAFVNGIDVLHELASKKGVLVTSGASTVPAISAAAVDAVTPRFSAIRSIEHAISPGNRTPRGDATVASILAMCGRPVDVWIDGTIQTREGWSMTRRQHFSFGNRWVSLCDVPDLSLFPKHYPGVRHVVFRAGLELPVLHFGTWLLARLAGMGLIRNLSRHAVLARKMSEWFLDWGTNTGGMQVEVTGIDHGGQPLTMRWDLTAAGGDGPQIPATPAVVLATKLLNGELVTRGAMPCMGLLELEDMMAALASFDVSSVWTES